MRTFDIRNTKTVLPETVALEINTSKKMYQNAGWATKITNENNYFFYFILTFPFLFMTLRGEDFLLSEENCKYITLTV